jgi:uncharacterized protein
MLGFSLPKLIVLIIIVVVVWKVFNWGKRINRRRAREEEVEQEHLTRTPPKAASGAEDMIRCPVCDVYITALGARHCGRADCPYPR